MKSSLIIKAFINALALSTLILIGPQSLEAKGKNLSFNRATVQQDIKESSNQEQRVNINIANAAQLSKHLKGVGLKKAKLIVEYREQFGNFKSAEELTAVKGIGVKTLARNINLISL